VAGHGSAGAKLTILPRDKNHLGNSHYWLSLLLAAALIPLLKRCALPIAFDWMRLGSAYWLVLAAQSIFVATILSLLRSSPSSQLRSSQSLRQQKLRILLLLIYFLVLCWMLTWVKALVITVDTIAASEVFRKLDRAERKKLVSAVFVPAFYLFVGFLLVFAYNDIILTLRFFGATDAAFNTMDRWLLHGLSVSELCHWAVQHLSVSFFHALEFIYFGMFSQIGAGLILIALFDGRRRALQFVGTILTAYYLALVLFYLWPSQGPFYLCAGHFIIFPHDLQSYAIQKWSIANSQGLWRHAPIRRISTDYYVAFPCMHIAQPLVVMWFLRRWKRILAVLAAYDVLLVVAIVLLEWHYVVDVIAGVLVAAMAIAVVDGCELGRSVRRAPAFVGATEE
jgi:hypothetical protein